ncbi:MAG TPA: erythromycin esterase family protein [Steroidobacteraceae bacterium]|nr:erythromycin esterase family protein [Steroidobacteraceae bacterium]
MQNSPNAGQLRWFTLPVLLALAGGASDATAASARKTGEIQPDSKSGVLVESAPFLNLDFERATPQGMPLNWYIEAEEAGARVRVAIDAMHARSGRTALRIVSDSREPIPLYTPLFLDQSCYHEAILTGFSYADARGIAIRPILFAQGGPRSAGETSMPTGGVWQSFQHRMTSNRGECLPDNLKIGLLVLGPGEVWVDGLRVVVDGRAWGADKETATTPSQRDVRTLRAAAVDLQDFSANASRPVQARAMQLFRSARVIALGENSHGAAALFRMKLELIRFLVRERRYTVLALEAPAAEADKVNDYVLGGTATRETILRALTYPSWQTAEMWSVVEWLRDYNRTAKVAVQFRGFDVQQPRLALAAIATLVATAGDPAAAATLDGLDQALSSSTPSDIATVLARLGSLGTRLDTNGVLSTKDRQRLARYVRTFERGLRMDRPDVNGQSRDAYMAEEVMDLLEETASEGGVILWADNSHVTRFGGAMGAHLGRRLHDDYLAIGFTFNRGHYSAYGPALRYAAQMGFPGTHEYLLSKSLRGANLVMLASLPATHPLRQIAGFRYIGSRPQLLNQFHPHRLEDHFDAIGFVESTDSTRYLVKHVFE